MRHSVPSARRRCGRRGFTLIELLVVISIIMLLMSILIPSMRKARDHAKEVACGALMHGLGNGLANYLYENNDWIPGENTSGVALRSTQMVSSSDPDSYKNKRMPVQPQDWLSPIVDEPNLPANRAERYKFLLDHYKCPAQADVNSIVFGNAPDSEDFAKVPRWQSISFLMPDAFQRWGKHQRGRTLAGMKKFPMVPVTAITVPDDWEVVPDDYESKLLRVGNPGKKVFIADGTRYLDDQGVLDFDIALYPNYFGSFTSSGAWWCQSTAYGVRNGSEAWSETGRNITTGSPSNGQNLRLSYRHSSHDRFDGAAKNNFGMMDALFYDGHVNLLNDQDSRKVDLWYPKGAKIMKPTEGMTDVADGQVVH